MFGEISYIGWFHTIVGTAAIIVGLYLLIKDRFIFLDKNSAKFYIAATVITSASSLFIYSATGSFNLAQVLSVMTIIATLFAVFLHRCNFFGLFGIYQITRMYREDIDGI